MNDEFLYQEPPPLRGEFVDKLYVKISKDRKGWAQFLHSMILNPRRWRVAVAFTIGLIVIVACTRLLLEPRNVQVGPMWVQEGGDTLSIPKHDWGANEQEEPVLSSPPEPIPLNEAIGRLPYKLKVPEPPEGFSLVRDTVAPPTFPNWMITLTWLNGQNNRIVLNAYEREGQQIQVPRGMWKEVSVNGFPAVLVRGDFPLSQLPPPDAPEWKTGFELTWDKNAGLQLFWNQGGAGFWLQTFGTYLDEDDLIRMAELMRTW